MRLLVLLKEVVATAWATKVSSILAAVVVGAMCCASILTVGKTASNAAAVAAQMEGAGGRRLSVIDGRSEGFINARTLTGIQAVGTVERAVVLGTPSDVTNGAIGPGGIRVPAWPFLGAVDDAVTITRGRHPEVGEAVVSASALRNLGLAEPVGFVVTASGERFPVVGAFTARSPFDDLAAGVLIAAAPDSPGRELRVVVTSMSAARPTVAAVLGILGPTDMQGVYVESPTSIADTARGLNDQLSTFGRSLLLMILGAGGFFVAAVVLTDVLVRRRDLGRRRTLGITRLDLASLVTLKTALTATVGAVAGCSAAWWVNRGGGITTPVDFTCAVGVLGVLVASLAAIPPAVFAAFRDPVAVMRTP